MKNCLRPADTLTRFGGDESAVLLEGVHSLREVDEVGRRLLRTFDEPLTSVTDPSRSP